jgi:high-affinity iron transporter
MRALAGLLAAFLFFLPHAVRAQDAALAVHLLDYIAADYAGAVADGQVKSADEFKEMAEFAGNVSDALAKLPDTPSKARLVEDARELAARIGAKSPADEVSAAATRLRQAVVVAYRVAVGPKRAPDLARGAMLFAEHCASCHGATGLGDGIAAKGLDPAPANFHDRERQQLRSSHALFSTITRGVPGTSMRAFSELGDDDRWALAYVAANWGSRPEDVARGRTLWESGRHAAWSTHAAVAGRNAVEVRAEGGEDAVAVLAYLRANPSLLDRARGSPIDFALAKLDESIAWYRKGDPERATQAALASYLEGFEQVEVSLKTVDAALVGRVEAVMIEYRNALKSRAPVAEAEMLARTATSLLEDSRHVLSSGALSPTATFVASFVILLREGLEAVLVVAALLTFLRRGGQGHAARYVHGGWIAALVLGAFTWFAASALIEVSGAHREVAEGVTGVIAAAMLIYVGFWLHDKSHSQAWQSYLMKGAEAVKPGAAWGLATMSFLAVYREVFETVLFYEALWIQAAGQVLPVIAGLVAALAVLLLVSAAMLRYAVRLPIGTFFSAGSLLMAALAVILAGNAVASLQEAGWLPITPVAFVTIQWLGIHPNVQAIGTQVALTLLVVAMLRASSRRSAAA